MATCPNCDKEFPNEARFCPYCGYGLLNKQISPMEAVLILVLTFVIMVFGLPFLYTINFPMKFPVLSAIGELMFLLIPLIFLLHKKVNIRKYIMFGRLKHIGLGFGLGVGLWCLSFILSISLMYLLGPSKLVEETNLTLIPLVKESPTSMMLVVGFIPGICEEFAFRSFLQNAFKSRYSFPVSLVGASIAFGLFHFDPQAIYTIASFAIGLYLGYFYNRFQSYIMTSTAHATNNMISLALLLLL